MKPILSHKVNTRVTPDTYRRLRAACQRYGFSSVYEPLQCLIHCFLRAAYPEDDPQSEPLPYDVERMFDEMADAEKHVEFTKPKRRAPGYSVNDQP